MILPPLSSVCHGSPKDYSETGGIIDNSNTKSSRPTATETRMTMEIQFDDKPINKFTNYKLDIEYHSYAFT